MLDIDVILTQYNVTTNNFVIIYIVTELKLFFP